MNSRYVHRAMVVLTMCRHTVQHSAASIPVYFREVEVKMEKERAENATATATPQRSSRPSLADQEKIRLEFYATYDAMTGVRIAATLGGFFGLMAFLLVCKSRSKSVKALNDPKIVEMAELAVAEEEAEEEERRMLAALEAVAGEAGLSGARARLSLGDARDGSFSPRRPLAYGGFRGASLPASALRRSVDEPPSAASRFLAVPSSAARASRRFSSVTCSSSGSSYLERRGSSLVCALPAAPPPRSRRGVPSPSARCPVDINVIRATPEMSPCASERSVRAPLASLGSFAASVAVECRDPDCSLGSDSVFFDDDECVDTDDEVEQFSTDSDEALDFQERVRKMRDGDEARKSKSIVGWSLLSSTLMPKRTQRPRRNRSFVNKPIDRTSLRRLSHPVIVTKPSCSTISAAIETEISDTAKVIRERRLHYSLDVERGPDIPPDSDETSELITSIPLPFPLSQCSRSRETLF